MLSDAIYASVPNFWIFYFDCLGSIVAFITTVNAARCLRFSLNEAVESVFFSY